MNYINIVYAVLALGSLGLLFGVLLGYASKKFEIQVNPKIPRIRAVLPGANCGGCGFPGCDAYAAAIVDDGVGINFCSVGGAACAAKIAEIVGDSVEVAITNSAKNVAFVKCSGDCSSRKIKADLKRATTCAEATALEGIEGCSYGCLGLGCCTKACKFGAISVIDGIAIVDEEKCVNCGACIKACPRGLIEAIPMDKEYRVACNSKDIGKTVRENCSKGCIACRVCEKNCPSQAITVSDNIASVDYTKCVSCGVCATKCPVKVITGTRKEQPQAV